MLLNRCAGLAALALALPAVPTSAGSSVPFRGVWQGVTISAVPQSPNTVLVVASGKGTATRLGQFQMTSPHLTYLSTLQVEGTQTFTAANGDLLFATVSGQFVPDAEGNLDATLSGVITGGTGRFSGATGSYDFRIHSEPAAFGFDSTAEIDGSISSVGSGK